MDFVKCSRRLRPAIVSLVLASGSLGAGALRSQADPGPIDPGSAEAAGASETLERFFSEVDDLTTRFEERAYDDDGELIESMTSTGSFSFLRPDRFRLRYETPYEEIFVADGEWIWQYDVDFEEANRRPSSELEATPAMLLSGEGEIGESFRVSELPSADGVNSVELRPVNEEGADFASATVHFRGGVPFGLEWVDALGRRHEMELIDAEVNSGLLPGDFEFVPPAGVNVAGADD